MLDILCRRHWPSSNDGQRHWPSSSKDTRSTWDLRNPASVAPCLGKEGVQGRACRWGPLRVEATLATRAPWALKSTFSSEVAPGCGGKKAEIEELWQELFSYPNEWHDHRWDKPNPRFPDFKHKTHSHKALWLDSKWIPPWVEAKLASKGCEARFSSDGVLGYQGKKAEAEELWQEFFSDPTKWRDHRLDKRNPRFPDFKHITQPRKALWMDSKWISPWVEAKLATLGWESKFSPEGVLGYVDKKGEEEKLWQEFFWDPTEWTDHRSEKINLRFPDFKHKKHPKKALWLKSKCIPPWVEEKLKALPPGSIQLSTFSWNQQLSRCAQAGQYEKTIELFQQMKREGETADRFTFLTVLKACSSSGLLEHGRHIHTMMQPSFKADLFIGTCLVDMYAKCGSIEEAEAVFNQMPARDTVTFGAMIGGYVKCGEGQKALEIFEQMQDQEVDPSVVTFVGLLNACASIAAVERGRRAHEEIIHRGYDSDVVVGTCLVDMYAKCGSIEEAEMVFNQMPTRNAVTFNAMIGGYVKCGEGQKALKLFELMQGQGVDPSPVTFVGVLNACASVADIEGGKRAHEEIIHRGYESDVVMGNSLIDMYAKCGSIEEAEMVFNQMPSRNVVTFNAMIGGYVKCGVGQKALELFKLMQGLGVDPSPVTFVAVLNACASVVAIEGGRRVHEEIIDRGYESDVVVGNSLIDMYAKCGSIEEAEMVFNQMPMRDVVTWNAMLAGYGIHGYARRALETFTEMCEVVEVNSVTFLSLLSACSHGGLVADGLGYLKSMSAVYNVTPTAEHFACVVDLLGRAGHFGEAEDLINSMPMDPDLCVWMALLGACGAHVNVEVGERCAKRVLELEPDNAAAYVLLSNLYVAAGKFASSARLSGGRLDTGVMNISARTWIEVNAEVHTLVADDCSHPQIEEIHSELDRLSSKMKDCGYVPDIRIAQETRLLWCVTEEEKKFHLCCCSEKLAIAFGLISTAPGTSLLIQNTLRVCRDCHTATKFISKIVGREITVKDADRFHHFKGGVCSCGDNF